MICVNDKSSFSEIIGNSEQSGIKRKLQEGKGGSKHFKEFCVKGNRREAVVKIESQGTL